MTLKMSRPWKHPRSGVYWLRKRVPDDLLALIGKREEKFSLQTRDPDVAKRHHAQALADLEARWANLRRGPKTLTAQEVHEIARQRYDWFLTQLAQDSSAQVVWDPQVGNALWGRADVPAPGPSEPGFFTMDKDYVRRIKMQNWCRSLADDELAERGLVIDEISREKLVRAISSALQQAGLEVQRQAESAFGVAAITGRSSPCKSPTPPAMRSAAVSFDDLLNGWAAEKRPTPKTEYSWRRVFDQLGTHLNHRDAARISADDLIGWKTSLVESGLRAKTIREGKLAPVRAVLQWAVDNRKLSENPAERITITVKAKAAETRRGYTEDEARTVLSAAARERDPVRRWVPLLCAYSGARVAEVCQARAEDVVQQDGIWCVRFLPEAGSLKNVNSERAVPLHAAVIDAGFLDFVRGIKSGPLFASLRPDRFGSRGGTGTKVLGGWVRSLGMVDGRISPSHSWRHRLKTLGRRYGLALDIVDAITGHGRKTVADSYGEFPIEALHRELSKIPVLRLD